MKQSDLAKKAIETLKGVDIFTKPVLISANHKRINIALVHHTINTVEYVLSFGLDTGVVRVFTCEKYIMSANQLRAYEKLADELHELSKEDK